MRDSFDRPLDDLCQAAYHVLADHECGRQDGAPPTYGAVRCDRLGALYDALVAIRSPWLERARRLPRLEHD